MCFLLLSFQVYFFLHHTKFVVSLCFDVVESAHYFRLHLRTSSNLVSQLTGLGCLLRLHDAFWLFTITQCTRDIFIAVVVCARQLHFYNHPPSLLLKHVGAHADE